MAFLFAQIKAVNNRQSKNGGKEKMRLKKLICAAVSVMMIAGTLTACGNSNQGGSTATGSNGNSGTAFDTSKSISVISREDGSGTRGAFIELFGIEEKDASGKKVDKTTTEATITNSTSVMMTTVAGDVNAIGYISLGSLNDTVKALKIGGTEATAANVKNGTYKVARPFNIATKGQVGDAAQDFINYIMSKEGQAIIEKNGYVTVNDKAESYKANSSASGKVVVAGSSSVTPVMEKIKEAYKSANSKVEIEIQESDSTTGMTSTIDGICQIGMASRALKDSEKSAGLKETTIAMDGIAVIVNKANTTDNMTNEQVKKIFTGSVSKWADALK